MDFLGILVWVVSFFLALAFTLSGFYLTYLMLIGKNFESYVGISFIEFNSYILPNPLVIGAICLMLYFGLSLLNYLIYKPLKNKFFKK
tara:strand:+ start:169 stop:432 length:264 start_codon:yes stop_codon:yes gene_type:complete